MRVRIAGGKHFKPQFQLFSLTLVFSTVLLLQKISYAAPTTWFISAGTLNKQKYTLYALKKESSSWREFTEMLTGKELFHVTGTSNTHVTLLSRITRSFPFSSTKFSQQNTGRWWLPAQKAAMTKFAKLMPLASHSACKCTVDNKKLSTHLLKGPHALFPCSRTVNNACVLQKHRDNLNFNCTSITIGLSR